MIVWEADSAQIAEAPGSAEQAARRNWSSNRAALLHSQPDLAQTTSALPSGAEWVWARDGSLTTLCDGNRWWGGCSLPLRAAQFMLRKADLSGAAICFLSPSHAAQIRAALDAMTSGQALIPLVPDESTLRMLLACEDFSSDVARHRLYFAAGEQWEAGLDQLLEQNPGLATPTSFLRPILADSSVADAMIAPAQGIFARHAACRSNKIRTIRNNWRREKLERICVVAPSLFRLWDDTGHALATAFAENPAAVEARRFDSDDPASSSPLALASAAAECDAIVTPNMSRVDFPELAPDEMPWATWLTVPRIPQAARVGKFDSLLVADPAWKKLAIEKGWDARRVRVATWPAMRVACVPQSGIFKTPMLAIMSNTRPLDPPRCVEEYSSHRLLWEAIRDELLADPFAIGDSPERYLNDRIQKAPIEAQAFSRAIFIDGIVAHAYQQGLARMLIREGLPVQFFGDGWNGLEEMKAFAGHSIASREQFIAAISSATALIHVWPGQSAHAIGCAGKPVIHPCTKKGFRADAIGALNGRTAAERDSGTGLDADKVIAALSTPAA